MARGKRTEQDVEVGQSTKARTKKPPVRVGHRVQSQIFCETHMQVPVGDMIFHVFNLSHNKKYPGWSFDHDYHTYHELIYTVRGEGYYEIDEPVGVKAGHIFFTPRYVTHHGAIKPGCELWESLVIGLDFSFARDPEVYLDDLAMFPAVLPFYRHFMVEKQVSLVVSPELRPQIELVVERLSLEVAAHPFDYDVVLQSQVLELLSLVCRAAREQMPQVPLRHYATQAKSLLRLEKARQFICRNLSGSFKLEDAAAEACMSQYHFARQFKEAFGQTPMQYLANVRMTEARRLLVNTDMSVAEVSCHLGYSSPEHFSRQFAAKVGVAPSNYARDLAQRVANSGHTPDRDDGTPPETTGE